MDMFDHAETINQQEEERRRQRDKDYEKYKKEGRIWGLVPREWIKQITFPRVSKDIINEYLKYPDLTPTISDLLDSHGIRGAVASSHLKPLIPGKKIVGHAVTIRNIPERKTVTQGYVEKDFLKFGTRDIYPISEPGDILVADFGGNLDVSNGGGMSCYCAKYAGLAGSVFNGSVRDADMIKEIDYPVWSCGTTPMTGKFRLQTIELNGPVTLYDILVMPGDLIVADGSGVCTVPFDLIEDILKEVIDIYQQEEPMRKMISEHCPLNELRPLTRKRYTVN